MVLPCNHRLQVGLAHICTDVAEVGRRTRRERKRRGVRCSWELLRCGRKRAFMYLPCLMRVGRGVFYKHEKDNKIQLDAFLRQPVVSLYLTSMGLDFLGVTTKAHFPAQAAEAHSWMYQLCTYGKSGLFEASPDAMPGIAIPMVGDPFCSGLGWQWGPRFPIHLLSAPEQWGFQGPILLPSLCCLGVQWLGMVAGKDGW